MVYSGDGGLPFNAVAVKNMMVADGDWHY